MAQDRPATSDPQGDAPGVGPAAVEPWGLLIALSSLNVLNFADRYLIIAFATRIIPDLGLTHLQFGLLTGIVFTLIYTVIGLYFGSLADRTHRPRLIAAGLTVWSALTAATGAAQSFMHMAGARMLVGVGEATLTPAALSILAERFSARRRAFANAFYYLGIPVGIGSSFILAGILGPRLGWRGSFIAMGLLGVAAALLVLLWMREPRSGVRASGAAHGSLRQSMRGIRQALVESPAFGLILLGSMLAVFVQGAAVLDVVWWTRERGYPESVAQSLNGTLFLCGGVFGSIAGGLAADAFGRRHPGGRLQFLGWALALGIPVMLAFRLAPPGGPLFLVLCFLTNAVFMLVFGPALASIQQVVAPQHRAAAISVFVLVTSLFGSAGGAAHVGWLSDRFAAAGMDQPLTWAIIATQAWGLLAVPAFLLAAHRLRRRELPGGS